MSGCAALRPTTVDALPPHLQEKVEVDGRSLRLNGVKWGLLRDGSSMIAVHLREARPGGSWSVTGAARSPWSKQWRDTTFLIDAGYDYFVGMDRRTAHQFRPWISAELGRSSAMTIAGPAPVWHGVLDAITVQDAIAMSPVPVRIIDSDTRPGDLIIGMGFLESFAGVIFDWKAGQLFFLPLAHSGYEAPALHRDSLRGNGDWVSVDWRPSGRPGATGRLRTVELSIEGRRWVAALDTAAEVDLLLWSDAPIGEGLERGRIYAAGKVAQVDTSTLAGPIECGDMSWESVLVERPHGEPPGVDAIIGVGLLSRQAVWFDFEGNAVRFWTADTPPPWRVTLP